MTKSAVPSAYYSAWAIFIVSLCFFLRSSEEHYFYQALQFKASSAGLCTFTSDSSTCMSTFGCLYETPFDLSDSADNLIGYDDASGFRYQFQFTSTLQSEETYILVVTTSIYSDSGSYSAIVNRPRIPDFGTIHVKA